MSTETAHRTEFCTRILPQAEYGRLIGTELEAVAPYLPSDASVLVVEADGTIVACWAEIPRIHLEGLWTHPDHRGHGRVGWRLLEGMRAHLKAEGVGVVVTASLSPDVDRLLAHVGAIELPGKHFVWRMH